MVLCVSLGTLLLLLVTSCEGEEHHELVSCMCDRHGALYKVIYFPLLLVKFSET